MASTSKKWAKFISSIASKIYFLVIIFQIPLFRIPCGIGICTSPLEVTLSHLIASGISTKVVKPLFYPGAMAKAIIKHRGIPSYNNMLNAVKLARVKEGSAVFYLENIEVLGGSYFSVAGAFLGLIISGTMSILGMLVIVWGISKEVITGKHAAKHPSTVECIYWTMTIAVLSAFFSVRKDVRKLIHCCKLKKLFHPLRKHSKAKFK